MSEKAATTSQRPAKQTTPSTPPSTRTTRQHSNPKNAVLITPAKPEPQPKAPAANATGSVTAKHFLDGNKTNSPKAQKQKTERSHPLLDKSMFTSTESSNTTLHVLKGRGCRIPDARLGAWRHILNSYKMPQLKAFQINLGNNEWIGKKALDIENIIQLLLNKICFCEGPADTRISPEDM